MKRATVLVAIGIGLAGCGKTTSNIVLIDPGPPQLVQGWQAYDRPEHGFSIAAPPEWSIFRQKPKQGFGSVGMDAPAGDGGEVGRMLENMNQAMEADAAAEAEAQAEKDKAKEIFLRLYDNGIRIIIGEIQSGMTVRVTSAHPTLEAAVKDFNLDYPKSEWRKGNKRVQLPIGPAEEVLTEITDVKGDVVSRISYIVLHKDREFIVTFVTTNNATNLASVARPMMDTFRVKL